MSRSKYQTRKFRHQKIRDVIEGNDIATQEQLIAELRKHGIFATQATLSRDLSEIGVVKMRKGSGEYIYKVSSELSGSVRALRNKFINFVHEIKSTSNLIIIKTPPGEAQGVARAIDLAEIEHILGTVAGDDTILVVVDDPQNARIVCKKFQHLLFKPRT